MRYRHSPTVTRHDRLRLGRRFIDRQDNTVFSITIYDTREDLDNAMREADSEYRFAGLAALGCTAIDARSFEVVAEAVDDGAAEFDFATLVPPEGDRLLESGNQLPRRLLSHPSGEVRAVGDRYCAPWHSGIACVACEPRYGRSSRPRPQYCSA
ncbi:hypothetical protein [Nocardia sp. NPDC047654]|uniref:hypothetical protein n=1 Tax=Nocardia sp. NPDC047654 TaxID=3364314 RepID=UPI003712546C